MHTFYIYIYLLHIFLIYIYDIKLHIHSIDMMHAEYLKDLFKGPTANWLWNPLSNSGCRIAKKPSVFLNSHFRGEAFSKLCVQPIYQSTGVPSTLILHWFEDNLSFWVHNHIHPHPQIAILNSWKAPWYH